MSFGLKFQSKPEFDFKFQKNKSIIEKVNPFIYFK